MLASILLPLVALLASTPALGRIGTLSFPSTAYLGERIRVNVTEEAHTEQWTDLGVLFGFQSAEYRCGTCVGQGQWYENLFDDDDYEHDNGTKRARYSIRVPVATNLNVSQEHFVVAAISYVAGNPGVTGTRYFNSSITLLPQRQRQPGDDDDDDRDDYDSDDDDN